MRSGQSFINHTSVLVSLFSATAPRLRAALAQFYVAVLQFSKFYEWKETLLLLIIEVHSHVVSQEPSDPKQWVTSPEF